jgi:hypothetical protein
MPQKQCPWCYRLGPRVHERDLGDRNADPHADGSACVCRHITCSSARAARTNGGRYWNGVAWVCLGGCRDESGRLRSPERERRARGTVELERRA